MRMCAANRCTYRWQVARSSFAVTLPVIKCTSFVNNERQVSECEAGFFHVATYTYIHANKVKSR